MFSPHHTQNVVLPVADCRHASSAQWHALSPACRWRVASMPVCIQVKKLRRKILFTRAGLPTAFFKNPPLDATAGEQHLLLRLHAGTGSLQCCLINA